LTIEPYFLTRHRTRGKIKDKRASLDWSILYLEDEIEPEAKVKRSNWLFCHK